MGGTSQRKKKKKKKKTHKREAFGFRQGKYISKVNNILDKLYFNS